MPQITETVTLDRDGRVAVLTIDNPPVNALSQSVRQGLKEGLEQALSSDAEAVVISCSGRTFIAGADITEFGKPPKEPGLHGVLDAIENASKPVVAATFGTILGGGLETALCCHYRVCDAKARFGLPEVNLGLLPGAGGTQRLPRVVGVKKALEMVTTGKMIGSEEALATGLVSEIVEGDLKDGAVQFANRVLEEELPLERIRDRDEKLAEARADENLFDEYRRKIARKTRGFLAPEYNVRCIEAAVNEPFDKGLEIERDLFLKLMASPESAAQRYYFFAERQAQKVDDVPKGTESLNIKSAGVLGAGTMGGGIAMNFANAGIPVTIVEREQAALDRGLAVIRKNYERTAKKGRISQEDVETCMGLITPSLDKGAFSEVDVVVEAVFEDMDLKKSIFTELDSLCRENTLLATNTSALDVNEIAGVTKRPEDVIGMHFFSPANIMKLVEVVRGDKSSPVTIQSSMNLSRKLGKIPVLVGVCRGFVGNRMLYQRRLEADRLIMEGAMPWDVDRVIYDFGFPMGPYRMSDLAGLDIGWKTETSSSSTIREVLCERGRRGQKTGKGYYIYDAETRAAAPDPEVEEVVLEFSKKQGMERREISDEEILARCLYPMVNEGAKILEEGIAQRSSDIDVIWVNGYGWPVYRGGPMFWGNSVGLSEISATYDKYRQEHGDHWQQSALLKKLADEGGSFR